MSDALPILLLGTSLAEAAIRAQQLGIDKNTFQDAAGLAFEQVEADASDLVVEATDAVPSVEPDGTA
jgi:hypothetical protein